MKLKETCFLSKQSEKQKVKDIESHLDTKNYRLSEKDIIGYILERFLNVKSSKNIKDLIVFHTTNKYMIMAHSQAELKILGNIVAGYKNASFSEILEDYESHLRLAISKTPTTKTHTNVILHIFGYFLKYLNQNEKHQFLDKLEQFQEGRITLGKILLEVNPITYNFDITYLASQTYFLLYSDVDNKILFQTGNIRKEE